MRSIALDADALLRGHGAGSPGAAPGAVRPLVGWICAAGLFYGAAMGLYGGLGGERSLQVLYSALKVPLLLLATFVLSLPSFFVLNTLLGVRSDFGRALRALVSAQAILTLVLASLAPYTLVWYASFGGYNAAILFNAAMFGLASLAAQWRVRKDYRPLIARNPRHRLLLRAWLFLYAFVGIQMGWILRPFIGDPQMPVRFFREDTWGNAYVIVVRIAWDAIGGGR